MTPARSLAKDTPDITALHSPRWREEGDVPVRQLGEAVPFFYTRAGAVMALEGQYRGGHAFLMANGPSVSALDLTPLQRRWVMTLNNGAKTFRGNANCTVDEPSRFSLSMWLDPTILKFAPMSHFEKGLWDNRLEPGDSIGSSRNQFVMVLNPRFDVFDPLCPVRHHRQCQLCRRFEREVPA